MTLRWQELPRACLPQLMSRRKMMNRKNTAEKIEKQPRVKSNALYLYSDIYWQFTAGSISAIQLSIWKVIKKTREDDTDYIHLPQFVYQPWLRFAHRRHDPNHVHVSVTISNCWDMKAKYLRPHLSTHKSPPEIMEIDNDTFLNE